MSEYLCIAVTYLDSRFHGRGDGGEPEWPPSPLRLMQAIVSANAQDIGNGDLDQALGWFEQQTPPLIIAPPHKLAAPYCLSVPNNAMDIVGKAWSKGNYFGTGDTNPSKHRAMKTIQPIRMTDGDNTVHYVWKLTESSPVATRQLDMMIQAARRVVTLGWGIDLVVGQADRISETQLQALPGERWLPCDLTTSVVLRTPVQGTLAALMNRYQAFIHRIGTSGFVPVAPLTQFKVTGYRRPTDPILKPYVAFELRCGNGKFCQYSQRRLMHLAGMVRHLAKKLMQQSPPVDVDDKWVERYVVGHRDKSQSKHRQFSYLPLPSIGYRYTDQMVRRVIVTAPSGDDMWLKHLARRLEGQQLEPERGDEFGECGPPTLVRVTGDSVIKRYTHAGNRWASVTPVILPGHDDHKPGKTRKLIETALVQSGIEQTCTFEWSAFSRFGKSYSAHKYDRNGKPNGYLRPNHLSSLTAVHLTLQFNDDLKMSGPLAIGAGRHCGLGLFAMENES